MKKKIIVSLLLVVAAVAVYLAIPANHYISKALWYRHPKIDQHKIFDNRVIRANNPQPWRIADTYNQKQLSANQLAYFNKLGTIAYVIIQDTAIVFEQYWENYDEHSLSNSFSAAKSIVSLLAGIARDEGKITDFNQSVSDYYPPYADDERKQITIKDLLTMSAGVDWNEAYSSLFSATTRSYYGSDLEDMMNELQLVEHPGKRYRYQSGVTQLLSFVISNAVGGSISKYASEKLWTPICAENDALWCLDHENGDEKAYCCFNTNARDFARIGQLILNKGKWNDVRVVSEQFIDEATTPATWLKDGDTENNVDFYGYQWWILNHNGLNVKYARGILGQYIFVIPEKNMVVVRLGHKRSETRDANNNPDDINVWLSTALGLIIE